MSAGEIVTAKSLGLAVCPACRHITDRPGERCSNCGAWVHMRKPNSLQKLWAFWFAGVFSYIPGNILPIMITETLSAEHASTVLGGVISLIEYKSYTVAAVIFIASIVVPVSKFLFIALIALSIQLRWNIDSHNRHHAHVIIEYIGRWSMVDVFVVAALSALIQLGGVIIIKPGPGIGFFALSVGLTMLSAQALDPRLIWDEQGQTR